MFVFVYLLCYPLLRFQFFLEKYFYLFKNETNMFIPNVSVSGIMDQVVILSIFWKDILKIEFRTLFS